MNDEEKARVLTNKLKEMLNINYMFTYIDNKEILLQCNDREPIKFSGMEELVYFLEITYSVFLNYSKKELKS